LKLGVALLAFAIATPAQAQEAVIEAWEPEPAAPPPVKEERSPGFRPLADLMDVFIQHYQHEIGPRSVSRCPFRTSCSAFARIAIEKYGAFGVVFFVDRFLYRENVDAFRRYPWVIGPDGTIRLDDDLE
jgi:hypothetical protein